MSDLDVDFIEEEDSVDDRIERKKTTTYKGMIGVLVHFLGFSEKHANHILFILAIVIFAISLGFFLLGHFRSGQVEEDFFERVPENDSRVSTTTAHASEAVGTQ